MVDQRAPTGPGADGSDAQSIGLAEPRTRIDRVLQYFPRVLASHAHIIFLSALGIYLVVLPLLGFDVSSKAELIGGNYTNVTSDLGACIAAGGTIHLVRQTRLHRNHVQAELERLRSEVARLGESSGGSAA